MENMYPKQFINSYMRQCPSHYFSKNIYSNQYAKILESNYNTGFIRLNITNQYGEPPVANYTITIYVTDGQQRDIPIMHLITTLNPIRIELPMAYEIGTQIAGPEYNFSTYNLRVDAFGYFASILYNIRLFPNTTTDFNIELVPTFPSTPPSSEPNIEERTDIPPHLRDQLN